MNKKLALIVVVAFAPAVFCASSPVASAFKSVGNAFSSLGGKVADVAETKTADIKSLAVRQKMQKDAEGFAQNALGGFKRFPTVVTYQLPVNSVSAKTVASAAVQIVQDLQNLILPNLESLSKSVSDPAFANNSAAAGIKYLADTRKKDIEKRVIDLLVPFIDEMRGFEAIAKIDLENMLSETGPAPKIKSLSK